MKDIRNRWYGRIAGLSAGGDVAILNLRSALSEILLPNPAGDGKLRQHAVAIGKNVHHRPEIPAQIGDLLDRGNHGHALPCRSFAAASTTLDRFTHSSGPPNWWILYSLAQREQSAVLSGTLEKRLTGIC